MGWEHKLVCTGVSPIEQGSVPGPGQVLALQQPSCLLLLCLISHLLKKNHSTSLQKRLHTRKDWEPLTD